MRKTFAEHLADGRRNIELAHRLLIEARSSFLLAAEESKIVANETYLDRLVNHLAIEMRQLDFERARLPHVNRTIADCLCFCLDDEEENETDYRLTAEEAAGAIK